MRTLRLLLVALMMMSTAPAMAQHSKAEIEQLQAEMYKYFSTPDRDKFFEVTDQLKEACQKGGNEQLFYKAWANQAIYETTHDHRNHALEITKEITAYAKEHGSKFGEYTGLHAMGSVYLRMMNIEDAEKTLLQAIEFLHENFPEESAAAEYLELVTVANRKNDLKMGKECATLALEERNLQPQHKIRAFAMLCQYAFTENDRERYNELYEQWKQTLRETSGTSLTSTVEAEYLIINEQYDEALRKCEEVPIKTRAELQAHIYEKQGDYNKAFYYLKRSNHVRDSINRVDQSNIFSDYIIQSQNERLENERLQLEDENNELRIRFISTLIIAVLIISGMLIFNRQKKVKRLKRVNKQLDKARSEAEKAREETQKALDVKREFLNNISHELRTPLNPITGMSDLLASEEYNLKAEERTAMSKHIKDSSKLLTHIIDNMIELSFYESKTALPMSKPISPNIICQHMVDALEPYCPPEVKMNYISTVIDTQKISTNVEGVYKIIKHLFDNALEHTERGTITLRCDIKDGRLQIAMEDTGEGVPKERADHVFDLFVETDEHVKTTGMGLSICQAILKLLDGRIWLDREYTKGARFVFELPME